MIYFHIMKYGVCHIGSIKQAVFVTVPLRCLHLNDLCYDWLIIWMCFYCVFPAWSRQCAEEGPAPAGSEAGRVRESPLLNQSSGGGTDRNGWRKTAGEETQTGGGGSAEGLTRMQHTTVALYIHFAIIKSWLLYCTLFCLVYVNLHYWNEPLWKIIHSLI